LAGAQQDQAVLTADRSQGFNGTLLIFRGDGIKQQLKTGAQATSKMPC
jgi:hypothetical protein